MIEDEVSYFLRDREIFCAMEKFFFVSSRAYQADMP